MFASCRNVVITMFTTTRLRSWTHHSPNSLFHNLSRSFFISVVTVGGPSASLFLFRPATPGRPNLARASASAWLLHRGCRHCLNLQHNAIFIETWITNTCTCSSKYRLLKKYELNDITDTSSSWNEFNWVWQLVKIVIYAALESLLTTDAKRHNGAKQ